MQPSALSVEPLILICGVAFLALVLPLSIWISLKCPPNARSILVVVGLTGLVATAFTLGRMTGLSMAWYHWKSEYKEPLQEWQWEVNERLKAGDTNRVLTGINAFGKENIQAYGREKLFTQGRFREFVNEQTRSSPAATQPASVVGESKGHLEGRKGSVR